MKYKIIIPVVVAFMVYSCRKTQVNNENAITVTLQSDTLIADGVSKVKIDLVLNEAIEDRSGITINVSTSLGTLSASSVTTDATGHAFLYLSSDVTGTATITSSINTAIVTNELICSSALPESISVLLPDAVMNHNLNTTLEVDGLLLRTTGTPSPGLFIDFNAVDSGGTSKGIFLNHQLSGADDKAHATFHLQDSSYRGLLFIKAVYMGTTDTIYGQNQILVQ